MPSILISYRRADSDAMAGRIRDRVATRYGEDSVFMDIDNIPLGEDFRDHVKKVLLRNDLVLVVIGPKWQGHTRGGPARIFDETDPVRMEVETALNRGIPVIPILVGGASMPQPDGLPSSLKDLPYRNAAEVSAGRDFHQHIERLLRSMDAILADKPGAVATAEAGGQSILLPSGREHAATAQAAPAAASQPSIVTRLLVRVGLRFADPAIERRFQEHFRDRFHWVSQLAMAGGLLGWVAVGPVDLWSADGGVVSTRFRFMFAAPAMAAVFGLSFSAFARRHWQAYLAGFALLGVSCMTFAVTLVTAEAWFQFEQVAMAFMLFLAFVGLAPFTFVNALGAGLCVIALYEWFFATYGTQLPTVRAIFCSVFVVLVYGIAAAGAYARERNLRWEFARRAELEKMRESKK